MDLNSTINLSMMSTDDSTPTADHATSTVVYAEKFEGYVAKSEVKEVYTVMKRCAQLLDASNHAIKYLSNETVQDSITKHYPAFLNITKATGLAQILGPAGTALGVGVDLMVKTGLVEDAFMSKLNEISRKVEQLRSDVERGFQSLKVQFKITQALESFLPVYNKLIKNIRIYEEMPDKDQSTYLRRLALMVKDYSPNKIIRDLCQLHALIVGRDGFCSRKPLFKQLEEELNGLKGKDADEFIANLLLQFQTVIGVQVRAIRMLRTFVAHCRDDVTFCEEMRVIFNNLAYQRQVCDPALKYGQYVRFMAVGGKIALIPQAHPDTQVYMEKIPFYNLLIEGAMLGIRAEAEFRKCDLYAKKGVLIAKRHQQHKDTFLISSKMWPDYYLYIMNTPVGEVAACKGDPGPQGHWKFTAVDIREGVFTLSTQKWPNYHLCTMKDIPVISDVIDGKLLGNVSDRSKTRAHFKINYLEL